ncbi:hypothetical protein V6N12_032238 [Hibiscus sabdariffa]|uniref:Uncharacterized protein n=1 Tax=Hibiscus sabdariffa TaxID=183260 RepID=A0ABR2CC16_9ROSI
MGKVVEPLQMGIELDTAKVVRDVGFMGLILVLNEKALIINISKDGRAEAENGKALKDLGLSGWEDGRSFFPELGSAGCLRNSKLKKIQLSP